MRRPRRPDVIARALAYVGRHGALFLAFGVLLGLAAPPLAAAARPLLAPALLVPLTIALLRLDWRALGDYARRPLLIGVATAWLLAASPLLVWLALRPLALPPALEQALVLMTASSPVTMCATVSLLVGLDAALAVVVIVVTTALVPLTLPVVALPLLGLELEIDLATLMFRLAWMVGAAFVAALVVRRFAGAERLARVARPLDAVAVLSLVVFAVAIMDGVTAALLDRPGYVLGTLVAAFAANLALQAVGTVAFIGLGLRRALTVGLMTGNCNMGIVLIALAYEAPFDTVMFFALGQIPMYMLPALLMPLYRRVAQGSMY